MRDRRAGRLDQIRTYTGKCFRIAKNERQWKFVISTLLIMIIVSMVLSDEMFEKFGATQNGLFAIMCGCIWVGIFNSIQSICKERAIIKKEKQTGLHISSYIMAHVNYEFVLCLAETVVVMIVLLVTNRKHLPDEGILFPLVIDLFISFFLVIFAADMLSLLVSCVVKTPNVAMTVMPFVLIVQLVFAGVVFELEGSMEKVANLTICKWGMQAVQVIANTTKSVRTSAYDFEEITTLPLYELPKKDLPALDPEVGTCSRPGGLCCSSSRFISWSQSLPSDRSAGTRDNNEV